jgi:hypothetical protein
VAASEAPAVQANAVACTHHDLFELLMRRHGPAIDVNGYAFEQVALLCLLQLCCLKLLLQLEVLVLHINLEASTMVHGAFILFCL